MVGNGDFGDVETHIVRPDQSFRREEGGAARLDADRFPDLLTVNLHEVIIAELQSRIRYAEVSR